MVAISNETVVAYLNGVSRHSHDDTSKTAKRKKKKPQDSRVSERDLNHMDDRGSRVRFPAGAGNFSLQHRVQDGSEAHPVSYPVGTRGLFLWG